MGAGLSSWNDSWGGSWGNSWGDVGASNSLRGSAAGSSSTTATLTSVVTNVIQGAPWWEAEALKKKSIEQVVLKNDYEDEVTALLLLKAA